MLSKSKRKNRFFHDLKDLICDCFFESKFKFFLTLFVVLIALVTGIIVAAKCFSSASINKLGDYGIVDLSKGLSSPFFARLFSMILVLLLLFGFSYTKFCMPLALLLIAYRSYLLGLNLAIMFLLFGFSGIIISVIVALPCQLICLAVLSIFYLLQCKCTKDFSCCHKGGGEKVRLLLLGLIALLLVCILETLLLLLFNAKVILVI